MAQKAERSILASSAIVSMLSIVSSLISFVNQLIIARLFGISVELSAYQIGISAPTMVSAMVTAGISYAMVPLLVKMNLKDSKPKGFQGTMLILMSIIAVVMILLGLVFGGLLVHSFGMGLPVELQEVAAKVSILSWITAGLSVILGHLSALHNSSKRFIFPALAAMTPYLGMIFFGLILGHKLGVYAIALGMLAGTAAGCLILLALARSEIEFTRPTQDHITEARNFIKQIPAIGLSMTIFTAFQFIDAYWAPQVSTSSLPTLGFCQRILVALGGFVIAGPFAVIVPRLAQATTEGRLEDFRNDTARAIRTLLGFAGLAAVSVSVLAVPTVAVMFQRGKFDATATEKVAELLPYMMAGMVPMLCMAMLFRAFYARNQIIPTVVLAVVTVGLYFTLSGVLSHVNGTVGIASSYALSWWIAFLLAAGMLWRENLKELLSTDNAWFLVKLLISLTITSALIHLVSKLLISESAPMGLARTLASLLVGALVGVGGFFILTAKIFQLQDLIQIYGFFGRLLSRVLGQTKGALP